MKSNTAQKTQPPSPRQSNIKLEASTLMLGDLPMILSEEEPLTVTRIFDAIRLDTTAGNGHFSFISRRGAFACSDGKKWKELEEIVSAKISDFLYSYAPGTKLKIEVHFSRKSTESIFSSSRQKLLYSLQCLLHAINLQSNLYEEIEFEFVDNDIYNLPVRHMRR